MIRRVLLALAAVALGSLVLVSTAGPAGACTCAADTSSRTDAAALADADAVFLGTVEQVTRPEQTEITTSRDPVTWTFAVEGVSKGDVDAIQAVSTPLDSGACGIGFARGVTHLVFAFDRGDELASHLCGGTRHARAGERPLGFPVASPPEPVPAQAPVPAIAHPRTGAGPADDPTSAAELAIAVSALAAVALTAWSLRAAGAADPDLVRRTDPGSGRTVVEMRPTDGGWSDMAVAEGDVEGRRWVLRWGVGANPMAGLRFHAGDSYGVLAPLSGSAVSFAVNVVEQHPVVWGLVAVDAIAVRVIDADGGAHVEPIVGPELDGSSAFVVVLAPGAEPVELMSLGRDGTVRNREAVVPQGAGGSDIAARIEVRAVARDHGFAKGTVVLEGTVEDATWEYGIAVTAGDRLQTSFELMHPDGGGGGGSRHPLPQPGASQRLQVHGSGTSGGIWHLTGWADPAVTEVVLRLRSGERLRLPTGGQQLGLGFVVFAVALPGDAVALAAEGYDGEGRRIAQQDLRGVVGWVEASIAEHRDLRARASAPPPPGVAELWRAVMGVALEEAEPTDPRTGARSKLLRMTTRADAAAQWPIRPLLAPAIAGRDAERWIVHGEHHRGGISQVVGIDLVWIGGPDLPTEPDPDDVRQILGGGAIILRQLVTWADPPGDRDHPNTAVRGRPAVMNELAGRLMISWQEPATSGIVEPASGLWLGVEADPRHHRVDDLRRFAEDLQPLAL